MSEIDNQQERPLLLNDPLLRDCIKSETLREILGRCDSNPTNIQQLFKSMNLTKTTGHDSTVWKGKENFLVLFFEDKLQDDNYNISLAELVTVLKGIDACSAIVREINDKFNSIVKETNEVIEERRSLPRVTATHVQNNNGHKVIVEIPLSRIVYVVFHRDQLPQQKEQEQEQEQKQEQEQEQEQQSNLSLDYFIRELERTFANMDLKFQPVDLALEENLKDLDKYVDGKTPVFLLYNKELHDNILDLDKNVNSSSPDKEKKLRRFYHLAYDRYCRDGCVNKWFYPFCLEDFQSTYVHNNHFKYRWLLQFLDRDRVAKFKQVPLGTPATNKVTTNLKEELKDFKEKFGKKLVSA